MFCDDQLVFPPTFTCGRAVGITNEKKTSNQLCLCEYGNFNIQNLLLLI